MYVNNCLGLVKIESYWIGFSGKARFRRANWFIGPRAPTPLLIWKCSVGPAVIALQLRVIQITARNKSRLIRFRCKQVYLKKVVSFWVCQKNTAFLKQTCFTNIEINIGCVEKLGNWNCTSALKYWNLRDISWGFLLRQLCKRQLFSHNFNCL